MSVPLLDNAVSVAYPIAVWISGLGGAALAVVLCTLALRALLLPASLAAVRGERARETLAPQVKELQRKHAGDPARLAGELRTLYREAGVSPLAGLLPVLAQAPFFLVLYRLFYSPIVAGHPNALLHSTLLGVPLSAHLVAAPLVFAPFLVVLAVLAWLAVRRGGARGLLAALPFGTLLAAAVIPLAGVLYLVTSTAWTGTVEVWLRRRAIA
jgi:YidC/Oxa1 family membrane protein insertase